VRRFLARLGSALLAAALLAAPSAAQDQPKLLIAATANDSGGSAFYAQDLGLFKKQGLNVEVQATNNPGAAVAAVIGGTVVAAGLTVPGIAAAREKGLPVKIIAPGSIYASATPTSGIIVLKDSPIRKASDLNGKTIATRDLSNMSYYGAKAWIDKNGGDSKSIKWVEVNDAQTVPAMQNGRVDAASVSEPALDDALHGSARLLGACYDAIGDHFLISAMIASEDYARAHPDIVAKISAAMLEANAWGNKHRAESAKILERVSGVSVAPNSTRVTYAEDMRGSAVQPVLDMLVHYGVLRTAPDPVSLFAAQVKFSK
jgi:NitT/TauT family transport system substrate-binding protein